MGFETENACGNAEEEGGEGADLGECLSGVVSGCGISRVVRGCGQRRGWRGDTTYTGVVHEGLGDERVEEEGEFLRCWRHVLRRFGSGAEGVRGMKWE